MGQRLKVNLSLLCLSIDRSLNHMFCVTFVDLYISAVRRPCAFFCAFTRVSRQPRFYEAAEVQVFVLMITLSFSYLLVVVCFGHHVIAYNCIVFETSSSESESKQRPEEC